LRSHGDLKLRHWLLILVPGVLCLLAWATAQFFGGYQAIRLRGFTLKRQSDWGQAQMLAQKCIGLDLGTAARVFNDDRPVAVLGGLRSRPGVDWGPGPVDWDKCEEWTYYLDPSHKIVFLIENDKVVGVTFD
jgi:hypothetical protein